MITAYTRRDLVPSAGDEERTAFEWGRLGLVQRAAEERGLGPKRFVEEDAGAERVEVNVEIDFDNNALPQVEDLVDRCISFFYDVDDGCLGRLRCAVDTTDEWRFVENLRLGVRPVLEERKG